MLSKSKSNRINLLKYALIIPMVFGMLLYTSSYAQERDKKGQDEVTIVQSEVSDPTDIEVPFSVIDEVPTTESCKGLATNDEKRQCFASFINDFVGQNFNTKLATELNLTGRQRISVMFKVGKDGTIQNVIARAPHPDLEKEAKRVVSLLPQMIPGKQKGLAVIVPYSLPILFQVNSTATATKNDNKKLTDTDEIPFSVVDFPPTSKECQSDNDLDLLRICTRDAISDYVNQNFNIKVGENLNLKGKQRISVIFKIDKDGYTTDVKSIGTHPKLEEEAIRVIKSLPQMNPGKQNSKAVVVLYSLPILFEY